MSKLVEKRNLGHASVDITLRGEKGAKALKDILVNTGATYTTLPPAVLEQVSAFKSSHTKPTRPKGVAYFYLLC